MGIRALTKRLEPHATPTSFTSTKGGQNAVDEPRLAVMDGPALCFHILAICVLSRGRRSSPFDNAPSYHELARTTVKWLQHLVSHGFIIQSILFDGFLPWSKKDERVRRMTEGIATLYALRAGYGDATLGRLPLAATTVIDPDDTPAIQRPPQLIPPVGFVAAILDHLSISEFADVTRVVPGEADPFCAEQARSHAAYIFTGDSDLLVYDLGATGRVIFFKDVAFSTEGSMQQMNCLVYHPSAIAAAHDLPNLLTLAYFAKQSPTRSAVECAALAKNPPSSTPKWDDFAKPYLEKDLAPSTAHLAEMGFLDSIMHMLHPRVSEVMLQLQFSSTVGARSRPLYVFVPEQSEDPIRTCAAKSSTAVRRAIYDILGLVDPSITVISEYCRSNTEITVTPVLVSSKAEALKGVTKLANWLKDTTDMYQEISPTVRWRLVAAIILCDTKAMVHKEVPSKVVLREMILNDTRPALSWYFLHTRGELTCILHYLLFLNQALHFLGVIIDHLDLSTDVRSILQELTEIMWTLPKSAELYEWQDCSDSLSTEGRQLLEIELDRLTTTESEGREEQKGRKMRGKKRKNEASHTSSGQEEKSDLVHNPYAALQGLDDDE